MNSVKEIDGSQIKKPIIAINFENYRCEHEDSGNTTSTHVILTANR